MDPVLIIALVVAIGSTIAAAVGIAGAVRDRDREDGRPETTERTEPEAERTEPEAERTEPEAAERVEPRPEPRRPGARLLLLVMGTGPPEATVAEALRMAEEAVATLVPAYLARVPETEPLDSPPPPAASMTLERLERRAAEQGVPVETRVQTGRSYRHALGLLLEGERFDPIIATASARDGQGLTPHDVAWLMERTDADVIVFRTGS